VLELATREISWHLPGGTYSEYGFLVGFQSYNPEDEGLFLSFNSISRLGGETALFNIGNRDVNSFKGEILHGERAMAVNMMPIAKISRGVLSYKITAALSFFYSKCKTECNYLKKVNKSSCSSYNYGVYQVIIEILCGREVSSEKRDSSSGSLKPMFNEEEYSEFCSYVEGNKSLILSFVSRMENFSKGVQDP
jgi:hypothetical protein